ncbi:hypothetical protein [Parasulfitobacter algicola]|uniref:DUF304 domain-containing protein n=1 Tax=Parasulfitobacter algicola TaxID=2614809 RepID=A0ABX2IK41_9RHOB|nr:hypothetical protein [Sulfitobacter algicola]NSX53247.1 hypothetical protein [Sulfitobacter algicola]
MKITRNTPDQLILDYTPWIHGIGIAAVTFAITGVSIGTILSGSWKGLFPLIIGGLTGGLLFVFFVERTQAIFDAKNGTVTLRRRTVFKYDQVQFDLSDVQQAVLEEHLSVKKGNMQSDVVLYRPSVKIGPGQDEGIYALHEVYTDQRGPQNIVDTINKWCAQAYSGAI